MIGKADEYCDLLAARIGLDIVGRCFFALCSLGDSLLTCLRFVEDFPEAPDTIGMQDERGGKDSK